MKYSSFAKISRLGLIILKWSDISEVAVTDFVQITGKSTAEEDIFDPYKYFFSKVCGVSKDSTSKQFAQEILELINFWR